MISTEIKSSGYENIVVACPLCNHELVLNRATDLCTFEPIAGTDVCCEECGREFWINGDSVNERHEAIVFDCHDLLRTKRYMNCILNVCQAYEMFFSLYLRVNILYIPFGNDIGQKRDALDRFNKLYKHLSNETQKFGFGKMRDVFLRLSVEMNRPHDLDQSKRYIDALSKFDLPKDSDIESLPDKKVAALLIRIKQTRINELRNHVVHKRAYRPRRVEAEDAVAEARAVLFPLTFRLNLHDDLNWYFSGDR